MEEQIDPVKLAPRVLQAYGTAMYGAQLLEDALVNLLLAAELAAAASTAPTNTLRELVDGWELRTLGQLLRTVEEHPHSLVAGDLRARLGPLKKRRDRLAHHFLREQLDTLIEQSRHGELIEALNADYVSFLGVADELNSLSEQLAPSTPLTKQDLDEIVRDVLDRLDS